MNQNAVSVFLGHPIEEPTEQECLARLRSDLEMVGSCLILANFYAGRAQRQIDFLIVTDFRAVHCELKGFSLPTIGGRNGPWQQRLPDGGVRDLDDNYYDQANKGTYAISDTVRDLRRRDRSVPGDAKFYRHVETVVGFFPRIPPGSEFERFAHVDVVGYEELLDRLRHPGRRPPWGREHWEALIRSLGLTPIDERSPAERTRVKREQQLEDYRRRFTTSMANDLPPLVGVAARLDGAEVDARQLSQLISERDTVFVVGDSGAGKSHLARHAAIELSDRGAIVVWTPALEYERGKLSALLRRATAPYSTLDGIDLIGRAAANGCAVIVIVDGLNECPPDARGELLDQLGALRMRLRLTVMISAQDEIAAPEALSGVTLRLLAPTAARRRELLDVYGAGGMDDLYPAFASPHELSIAAQCVADLPPHPTHGDVFDAYVRRRAPTSDVRLGLRRIAAVMRSQYRLAIQVDEAWRQLSRDPALTASPAAVDATFSSPLLRAHQGRLSFVHEDFARFFAAEHLMLSTADGRGLGERLRLPRHADLRDLALSLEVDDRRLSEALVELADPDVIAAAVRGDLGRRAAAVAHGVVERALAAAHRVTDPANCRLTPMPAGSDPSAVLVDSVRWVVEEPLALEHEAPLEAAGRCVRDGEFVEEVVELLDRTDLVCARAARELADAGSKRAISVTVAATYPQTARRALPGSRLVYACEMNEMGPWRGDAPAAAVLAALAGDLTRRSNWGRLYTTVLLTRRGSGVSDDFIIVLIKAGWDAVAYHLRLAAMDLAHRFARRMGKRHREELAGWLESLQTTNLFLGSSVLEALAACNAIDSGRSVEDILAEIDVVLATDGPEADALAAGFVTRQLEEQALVGPYGEALEELSEAKRTRLFVKAVRGIDADSFLGDFVVAEAAKTDLGDEELRCALVAKASVLALRDFGSHDVISTHMAVLDACAAFLSEAPLVEVPHSRPEALEVWRAVDRLLFAIFRRRRGLPESEVAGIWSALYPRLAAEVPVVLQELQSGGGIGARDVSPHDLLVAEHPAEVRRALEWALDHPAEVVGGLSIGSLPEYAIEVLGHVGNSGTAELLRRYLDDPVLGPAAIRAIGRLESAPAESRRRHAG